MKKKLLVLLMVLALSFTTCACGDKDENDNPQTPGTNTTIDDENLGTETDKQDYIEDGDKEIEYLNPEDLKYEEQTVEYSDDFVPYDFGMKISSGWGVSGSLAKLDYSYLEGLKPTLETTLKSSMASAGLGNFEVWSDYEDYSDDWEEDGIDALVYAMGLEDDNADKGYSELGVYHNKKEEKNYQYLVYYTDSILSKVNLDAARISNIMSSSFGVTVSKNKIEKAFDTVWAKAEETKCDYTVYETKSVKGKNYIERVTFSMNTQVTDDDTILAYAAVERERCYN